MASVLVLIFSIFIHNCVAQKSPAITYISPTQIKDIGATVTLECSVKEADDYAIIWKKSDETSENNIIFSIGSSLASSDYRLSIRHYTSTSTYTLQINDVEETDAGTYYCEISSLPPVSTSVTLQVKRSPIFLNNSTKSTTALEGEDVQLECYADGYPTPTITWGRRNRMTFQTGNVSYQRNVLLIESIRREDGGTYYCIADNKVGRGIKRNIDVTVEFAPVVTVPNSTVSQALGYDMNLVCHVNANPQPAITWLKNGASLSFNSRHHSISNFATADDVVDTILRLNSIEKSQYGKYVCRAANKLGVAEGEVELLESTKPVCISFCDEDISIEDNNTTLAANTTSEAY